MSEELDEKKMHAAACLRMLGVEGEAPFGACADVTADQREEARKYFVSVPFLSPACLRYATAHSACQ